MKLNKVALAVAGVLAIAAGTAQAGQIDSSSATLAREVIVNNSQVIRAPSKSYAFQGAIDARNNEQRLQLQWRLGTSGLKWSRLGDVALTTTPTVLPAGQDLLQLRGLFVDNITQGGFGGVVAGTDFSTAPNFEVSAFLADNDTTLIFNVTIPQNANHFVGVGSTFQLNANNFLTTAASNTGITNAFDVAGATACVAPVSSADIELRHYTTHFGNNQVISGSPLDSEHVRAGSTNVGRYVNFVENLRTVASPAVQSQVDAQFLRTLFIRTANDTSVTGNYSAAVTGALGVPATRAHLIGSGLDLRKIANGLDLDYTNQYGLTGAFAPADFDAVDNTGNLNTGVIELRDVYVRVSSPLGGAGVASGSTVALLDAANVPVPGTVTAFNSSGVATISVSAAAAAAAFAGGAGAKLYYIVSGTSEIPQNATFDVEVAIRKDQLAGAPDLREQDNSCKFVLSGVGGGIKIDIRNYASYASFGATGPKSVVRLINNSESQSADIFAQMIYADGTYGPWGRVTPTALAPREVMNIDNQALEALLVNASPVANPFGSGTVYTRSGGGSVAAGPKAGVGDRVRFVSNTGTTLRVQSYMLFPNGIILNTSDSQGVDFENESNNRTPTTAVDAQPNSQDAINGLAR